MIKSPLRYPGGKSKLVKKIFEFAPKGFKEYREPLLGGGSVFIFFRQIFKNAKYWINDLNTELYLFWVYLRDRCEDMVSWLYDVYNRYKDGRDLFNYLKDDSNFKTDFELACRYYALNRIVYSGLTDIGGYSELSFRNKFLPKFFERLKDVSTLLQGVKITNLDYSYLFNDCDDDTFIFLDPPYYEVTQQKLYGKEGKLHSGFDHEAFYNNVKNLKCKFMITYDYSSKIIDMYKDFFVHEIETTYVMASKKTRKKEAIITNYEVSLF